MGSTGLLTLLVVGFWVPVLSLAQNDRLALQGKITNQKGAGSGKIRRLEGLGDPPSPKVPRANLSSRSPGGKVQVGIFLSVQVNVDKSGKNILGDAANETSIAVDPNDPNKIVIGWRQFDSVESNFRQAGWAYSQDGGQTWTFPGALEPGVWRSDPVLDFDLDGNFYYLSMSKEGDVFHNTVFKSEDGGVSWNEGVCAGGGDKPWMAIDRTEGLGKGHIYSKWSNWDNCCEERTFTRSTTGGSWFECPYQEVPLGPSWGTMSVAPDGDVYIAGVEFDIPQDLSRIVVASSRNAQYTNSNTGYSPPWYSSGFDIPTFSLAAEVDLGGSLVFGGAPNPDGLLGQVWVATDHSEGFNNGNIYILASLDPPPVGNGDRADVMFSRSTNEGWSWSEPIRVNDDSSGPNRWQWFGTMSVAPNGRIDVIWNDTRNSNNSRLSELYYSYSTNAGSTWSSNMQVSPVFDSHLGWPNQNKIGDYYDMVSDNDGVNVAYAATFNGEQDIYFLRLIPDCNGNGILDNKDIESGFSQDLDENGMPDECQDILFVGGKPGDYPAIQEAIEAAEIGDAILVRPGEYVENINFLGKEILVKSLEGSKQTTINGNQAGSVVTFNNFEGKYSILDGFTLTNGLNEFGGGIALDGSNPRIRNCVITENVADGSSNPRGGGIYGEGSGAIIIDCEITLNTAGEGGGMAFQNGAPTITNCTIEENAAAGGDGGGIFGQNSFIRINSSRITLNAAENGGGVACYHTGGSSFATLIQSCIIAENTGFNQGGGVYCNNMAGGMGVSLFSTLVRDNTATNEGGGVYSDSFFYPVISNCTVAGNSSGLFGGGIFLDGFGSPYIVNSIFWDNEALNGPQIGMGISPIIYVEHSDVEGGLEGLYSAEGSPSDLIEWGLLQWGEENLSLDPLFDAEDENFHLLVGSPCIDSGDPGFDDWEGLVDIDGEPRVMDGNDSGEAIVDMGADEVPNP